MVSAREKEGGGCTQNNTLRFRGNAREKKRKGKRGIVVDRDCVISAGTFPADGGWWQTVGLENRGEKGHESLNVWAKLKGVDAELWNFHSTNVCTSVENIPTLQRDSGQNIVSIVYFFPFVFFIFFTYTIQMCTKEVNVLKFHNIYINLKKLDYKLIISNRWSFKR